MRENCSAKISCSMNWPRLWLVSFYVIFTALRSRCTPCGGHRGCPAVGTRRAIPLLTERIVHFDELRDHVGHCHVVCAIKVRVGHPNNRKRKKRQSTSVRAASQCCWLHFFCDKLLLSSNNCQMQKTRLQTT